MRGINTGILIRQGHPRPQVATIRDLATHLRPSRARQPLRSKERMRRHSTRWSRQFSFQGARAGVLMVAGKHGVE